jgi:hypothetical protein
MFITMRVERGSDGGGVGDVALERDAADLGRHLLRQLEVHVEHGHLGATPREFTRGGGAEAGGSAGDEGCLVLDLHDGCES